LNILFVGNELMAQRLARAFEKDDIKVFYNTVMPAIPDLNNANIYDLIIIDSVTPQAEASCQSLGKLEFAPVVLMVSESETNWKTICNFQADGFITTDVSDTEALARIKAIHRRSEKVQKILS
jgi:DNA-binding response OmpR family regulator